MSELSLYTINEKLKPLEKDSYIFTLTSTGWNTSNTQIATIQLQLGNLEASNYTFKGYIGYTSPNDDVIAKYCISNMPTVTYNSNNQTISFVFTYYGNKPDVNVECYLNLEFIYENATNKNNITANFPWNAGSEMTVNGNKITGNINFQGGGATTVSNSGNTITISSTDTKYTNGEGLVLNDTTFSLATVGTSSTVGPTSDINLNWNGTFIVPYFTKDEYGRVTSANTRTFTMPENPVKTGYITDANNRNYKVQKDSNDNLFVNVPWENTKYNVFNTNTNGLVPAPNTTSGKYLKDDGSWQTPPNTTVTYTNSITDNRTEIGTLTVNGTQTKLYAPQAGLTGDYLPLYQDGEFIIGENTEGTIKITANESSTIETPNLIVKNINSLVDNLNITADTNLYLDATNLNLDVDIIKADNFILQTTNKLDLIRYDEDNEAVAFIKMENDYEFNGDVSYLHLYTREDMQIDGDAVIINGRNTNVTVGISDITLKNTNNSIKIDDNVYVSTNTLNLTKTGNILLYENSSTQDYWEIKFVPNSTDTDLYIGNNIKTNTSGIIHFYNECWMYHGLDVYYNNKQQVYIGNTVLIKPENHLNIETPSINIISYDNNKIYSYIKMAQDIDEDSDMYLDMYSETDMRIRALNSINLTNDSSKLLMDGSITLKCGNNNSINIQGKTFFSHKVSIDTINNTRDVNSGCTTYYTITDENFNDIYYLKSFVQDYYDTVIYINDDMVITNSSGQTIEIPKISNGKLIIKPSPDSGKQYTDITYNIGKLLLTIPFQTHVVFENMKFLNNYHIISIQLRCTVEFKNCILEATSGKEIFNYTGATGITIIMDSCQIYSDIGLGLNLRNNYIIKNSHIHGKVFGTVNDTSARLIMIGNQIKSDGNDYDRWKNYSANNSIIINNEVV